MASPGHTSPKVTGGPLLHRDQIEFPRRFFIEQRALFRIATAPVLVSSGNTYEIARAYTLLAGVVFVQISPLQYHDPHVVRVSVHSRVIPRCELTECAMRSRVGIPPNSGHRHTFWPLGVFCLIGRNEDYFFSLSFLPLHPP